VLREIAGGVNGRGRRSFLVVDPTPKPGVKGVKGVLGVEMYLPPHFGQRTESSAEEAETGRAPFGLPARRGWYRYPGYCR
jgi:hypothetical protein